MTCSLALFLQRQAALERGLAEVLELLQGLKEKP